MTTPLTALPVRAQVAQLLVIGVHSAATSRADLAGSAPVGGLVLLGNHQNWFGDGTLVSIAAAAQVPPILAADEEGGRVQRIDAIFGPMPSARTMALTMTPSQVEALGASRGRQMAQLGLTMDFAPVADLYDPTNAVINDRAFDPDPIVVATYARAFSRGLKSAGVTPVLKHFPGHGHSSGDSHKQPVTTPPLSVLDQTDLVPFATLLPSSPAVMIGDLDVPGLTQPGIPASVSTEAITGLLRNTMKFDGLVLTDDLAIMKAITDRFSVPQAVIAALVAGADQIIVNEDGAGSIPAIIDMLVRAVSSGRLSPHRLADALGHIQMVKSSQRC